MLRQQNLVRSLRSADPRSESGNVYALFQTVLRQIYATASNMGNLPFDVFSACLCEQLQLLENIAVERSPVYKLVYTPRDADRKAHHDSSVVVGREMADLCVHLCTSTSRVASLVINVASDADPASYDERLLKVLRATKGLGTDYGLAIGHAGAVCLSASNQVTLDLVHKQSETFESLDFSESD